MTRSVPPRMRVVAKDVGGGLVVQARHCRRSGGRCRWWPQPLSSVGLQALVAPFERIPVAPLIETEPFGKLSRRSASSRCLCCDALTATIGGRPRPLSPHPDQRTQTWVGAKPLSECRNSATKTEGNVHECVPGHRTDRNEHRVVGSRRRHGGEN